MSEPVQPVRVERGRCSAVRDKVGVLLYLDEAAVSDRYAAFRCLPRKWTDTDLEDLRYVIDAMLRHRKGKP